MSASDTPGDEYSGGACSGGISVFGVTLVVAMIPHHKLASQEGRARISHSASAIVAAYWPALG
jgi:hypothetical protein